MKILLVEDLDAKGKAVESFLRTLIGDDLILDRARSYSSAVKLLQRVPYELLILDLVLPIRDGEDPNPKGGKRVLSEILESDSCHRPSHILCLTAFENIETNIEDAVRGNLVHVVKYDEISEEWRTSLRPKIEYVQQRLREASKLPLSFATDIAIITSSPNVEFAEVNRLPGPFVAEFNQADHLHYYRAVWLAAKPLSVVACAAPSMGMTAAAVTASKLINRWRPRFLVMTGIAASTQKAKDVNFGDILVALAAYDYGSGKISDQKTGKRVFMPSPHPLNLDAGLQAVIQQWARDGTAMADVRKGWSAANAKTPKIIPGVMACGAAVIQSKPIVNEILRTSRKVVGLEMESYGVFFAGQYASSPQPRVMVAKSVCDFADPKKKDDWQQYAAFTSARFVYEFFTRTPELFL